MSEGLSYTGKRVGNIYEIFITRNENSSSVLSFHILLLKDAHINGIICLSVCMFRCGKPQKKKKKCCMNFTQSQTVHIHTF
jgi:hypothetical protein